MSRIEIYHPKDKKALAFGNDHALGEYLQIWSTAKHSMPDADNILVDEDRLTGFDRIKMRKLIAEHGFTEAELEEAFKKYTQGGYQW